MHTVIRFRQYPFEAGQKICIEDGSRKGDWEVIGTDGGKVKLRCPISGREVAWTSFCYCTEEIQSSRWPSEST